MKCKEDFVSYQLPGFFCCLFL